MPHDRWTVHSVFAYLGADRFRWRGVPLPRVTRLSAQPCEGR